MERAMFLAKGSLFLGRMTQMSDGMSFILEANPGRCVWASDWPHPSFFERPMPNDGDLLDLLADWAPDDATRHRILVDNPARLYGF